MRDEHPVEPGETRAVRPDPAAIVPVSEPRAKPKTAVIVIHGMGEQWPMDTLRGFVDAAWTHDRDLTEPWSKGETYSKPERVTGNFELRRITTRYWRKIAPDQAPSRRVDFFEFYWAYLMQGNSFGSVLSWLLRLLVRRPSRVPRRLLGGWFAGNLILLCGAVLALLTAIRPDLTHLGVPIWIWAVLAAIGGGFSVLWLRPVAGDAARYLSASPENVAVRQTIREAGVDFFAKLQATGDYDRIIIAGHSLGSVISYDILNYAWGRLDPDELVKMHAAGSATMDLLNALEDHAATLEAEKSNDALVRYRDAQRTYFDSLSRAAPEGAPLWLVSDFVTMGAPLSKADVLLAKDAQDLEDRIALREVPVSPPRSERETDVRFSYPPGSKARIPHHGAVFAPVVWTNIYYPNVLGLVGDFISGPIAPQLGPGVRDIRVPIGFPKFRHLSYWAKPETGGFAIRALRNALNLRARSEHALWGEQATDNPVRAETLPVERETKDLA